MPSTSLSTPLCRLRPPRPDDAEAIFANYAGDPEVTRFMLWETHASIDATHEFLTDAIRRNDNDEEWTWCITLPDADQCIGMVGVVPVGHAGELGYVLARRYWGGGIMTAAASVVVDWCFAGSGLQRVWASCAVGNAASARVLEKLGMQREGKLRRLHRFPNLADGPRDCFVYARLAGNGATHGA